jgi:hypothetical protein
MITNQESGTRVDEIAAGIHRISTPVPVVPGGFTFNQYLIADEAPLLFHAGPRRMFPLVCEAIAAWLGMRLSVRSDDAHPALRRPVHPGRGRGISR